ncbi:hypothetical protein STENM36S_00013 [Streptomyces tendae]
MALSAAITGTRQTGHRELVWFSDLFARYLAPWATHDSRFYIGGARGIDSLSLLWLAGNSASRLTIVVPGTGVRAAAEARHAVEPMNPTGTRSSTGPVGIFRAH